MSDIKENSQSNSAEDESHQQKNSQASQNQRRSSFNLPKISSSAFLTRRRGSRQSDEARRQEKFEMKCYHSSEGSLEKEPKCTGHFPKFPLHVDNYTNEYFSLQSRRESPVRRAVDLLFAQPPYRPSVSVSIPSVSKFQVAVPLIRLVDDGKVRLRLHNAKFNVPPGADVDFQIELKTFEKAKRSWEMDDDEKLAECEKLTQRGAELLRKGKNMLAMSKYHRIVHLLDGLRSHWEGKREQRNAFLIAAYNNLAMVYLKLDETTETIYHCDQALEIDNKNVQGLFLKAQAYQHKKVFEKAIKSYELVLDLEPNNTDAKANLSECRARFVDERKRQMQLYEDAFGSFSKVDNKGPQ